MNKMSDYKNVWNVNIRRSGAGLLLLLLLILLLSVSFVASAPTAPVITYVSNTTYTSGIVNRSADAKGTITTVTLDSKQQDYKWKAYVGNITGTLALANSAGTSIYDWTAGTIVGEVYASRFSNINWAAIDCAVTASWNAEHTALGITGTAADSINNTFNYTNHKPITVATNPARSNCPSTATYINDAAQTMGPAALFQEVLLRDTATAGDHLIYSTFIESAQLGYDNQPHDFQILVAENESITTGPATTYFFWVELG
jgi:hypothetical protein